MRCRRGSWSYTILNNSPSFLFFQHGDFTLTVRIGASFCEHRNFVPAALAPKDGGYALHQTMTGWYYLPLPKSPPPAIGGRWTTPTAKSSTAPTWCLTCR